METNNEESVDVATSSRRDAFKKLAIGAAGALTAGGVIAAFSAESASATDGLNVVIGNAGQTSQSETAISYNGVDAHAGVLFAIEGTGSATASASKSALNGWVFNASSTSAVRNGIYGFTEHAAGTAVVARASLGTGIHAQGTHSNVMLFAEGAPAPSRSGIYAAGNIIVDASGDLWYCVSSGIPGAWRKLSGPATAGSLHLLPEPLRAYDSRSGSRLVAGSTTTISLATGRNGANVMLAAIPAGASAALVNITLTGTVGNFGFIQAYSAALASPPSTSVMNWSTPDDNVANEMTVKVDATSQISVSVGVNSTHVIADVVGYYR
jgi:hypothetical protein